MFGKSGKSGRDAPSQKNEAGITLIAPNGKLVGNLTFSDELIVNGIVEGKIKAAPDSGAVVRVQGRGQVKGEIRAPRISISGKVRGDIYGSELVEVAASAVIVGNVYYKSIEMVKGCCLDGQLAYWDGDKPAASDKAARRGAPAGSDAAHSSASNGSPDKKKQSKQASAT